MADVELLKLDRGRVAIPGIVLPEPPPTRVYISGNLYRISPSPQVPLPPIANVVKFILNWTGPAARLAKNIGFLKLGSGGVSSDPTTLQAIANDVMGAIAAGAIKSTWDSAWQLQSVTAKDAGGTSASATSTASPINGTDSSGHTTPASAVCLSWQIAESYRGGKPRWYLPAIPLDAIAPAGSSTVSSTYATSLDNQWSAFMTALNATTIAGGGTMTLGTVSYHSGHAVRPTPLFRTFLSLRVHERLDTQRRRNGKESSFGSVP